MLISVRFRRQTRTRTLFFKNTRTYFVYQPHFQTKYYVPYPYLVFQKRSVYISYRHAYSKIDPFSFHSSRVRVRPLVWCQLVTSYPQDSWSNLILILVFINRPSTNDVISKSCVFDRLPPARHLWSSPRTNDFIFLKS